MESNSAIFIKSRRSIYAALNARKGAMMSLTKSTFLNKEEQDAAKLVVDAMENLRRIFNSKKEPSERKIAMEWWTKLNDATKENCCQNYNQSFGRSWNLLTGREIEAIYKTVNV